MTWLTLPLYPALSTEEAQALVGFVCNLSETANSSDLEPPMLAGTSAAFGAAAGVLLDLARQGWNIRCESDEHVEVSPPKRKDEAHLEKLRVRKQELLKRDEQLRTPSVQRFIQLMESPRMFENRFVSIFDLMRDGAELAKSLRAAQIEGSTITSLRKVVDPYVEVVSTTDRCAHTGFRLGDIWRYFRHTWSNQYTTVPGRTMMLLVRDRAAPHHPVIGIAALGSAIVQINERDRFIGWRPDDVLQEFTISPSRERARWLVDRLERRLCDIYVDDLIADGLYWPGLWDRPTKEAIHALRTEATVRQKDHLRFTRRSDLNRLDRSDPDYWEARATTDLYRSKRCLALADVLRDRLALAQYLYPRPTVAGLQEALSDKRARQAIKSIARRAKADTVGTEIADLTVCGAVAPYNSLIAGKLVTMLALSPTVIRAYHHRYRDYESEIASSLAGRGVSRSSRLVYIGTTSLYGTTSSQYNRVRIPAEVLMMPNDLRLERLGRSRAFGTSHLSATTVTSLVELSEQSRNGARVNSIFGEGANPKLRKVRGGLDALGWPSNELLQHGRQRILYGVSLVKNLSPYLLGEHSRPQYRFPSHLLDDGDRISDWWIERWLQPRSKSELILDEIAADTLDRPVQHRARVPTVDAQEA